MKSPFFLKEHFTFTDYTVFKSTRCFINCTVTKFNNITLHSTLGRRQTNICWELIGKVHSIHLNNDGGRLTKSGETLIWKRNDPLDLYAILETTGRCVRQWVTVFVLLRHQVQGGCQLWRAAPATNHSTGGMTASRRWVEKMAKTSRASGVRSRMTASASLIPQSISFLTVCDVTVFRDSSELILKCL